MGALHVVGINFQLRLGVDLRIVGQQQVAIGLLGIGLLRVLVHHDAAVEHAMRVVVENAVVKLPAGTMRAGVLHQHVIIEMLPAGADKEPINQALAAFAGEHRMHIVAHECAAQQQRVRGDIGAARLLECATWRS